jgi:Icc-related predicted phosphoesterase
VRSYILFDRALNSSEIGELPNLRTQTLAPLPPRQEPDKLEFVLAPTIQLARTDEATIVWETNGTTTGEVRYGLDGALTSSVRVGSGRIHKVRLAGLQPGSRYSFQVVSTKSGQAKLEAGVSTFTTMPAPGQPLRFTVVGDTQEKPQINSQVAKGMAAQQPHFGMIVGDFVGAGWEKDQWTHEFFASMHPLWSKTPLVQVLGNHDRNAMIYYDQMALPKPYYCYSFRAGDAEIFSIDTGHSVQPGSEQYRWLEDALRRSTAKWKIAAHHYPPYSSDLDDYGTDLGDVEVRTLCVLYDRYNVDLVFSGHIHSYERHKPLRNGKPDPKGVTYVVVGGGGGDLEQFLPNPPDYSVVRKTTHHYGVVDVIGDTLIFRAYDLAGNRIDTFEIKK